MKTGCLPEHCQHEIKAGISLVVRTTAGALAKPHQPPELIPSSLKPPPRLGQQKLKQRRSVKTNRNNEKKKKTKKKKLPGWGEGSGGGGGGKECVCACVVGGGWVEEEGGTINHQVRWTECFHSTKLNIKTERDSSPAPPSPLDTEVFHARYRGFSGLFTTLYLRDPTSHCSSHPLDSLAAVTNAGGVQLLKQLLSALLCFFAWVKLSSRNS